MNYGQHSKEEKFKSYKARTKTKWFWHSTFYFIPNKAMKPDSQFSFIFSKTVSTPIKKLKVKIENLIS